MKKVLKFNLTLLIYLHNVTKQKLKNHNLEFFFFFFKRLSILYFYGILYLYSNLILSGYHHNDIPMNNFVSIVPTGVL